MPQTPQTHRPWLQFSLVAMLGMVMLVAGYLGWIVRPKPLASLFPDPTKRVAEVVVLLGEGSVRIPIQFKHAESVQLVLEPFYTAQVDPHPGENDGVGEIIVFYDDASMDKAMLLAPWGHFEYRDQRGIADMSLLREECRRFLLHSHSDDPDIARLASDVRRWE
jgi:hypothetical protein